jgi:hypothetical protein
LNESEKEREIEKIVRLLQMLDIKKLQNLYYLVLYM